MGGNKNLDILKYILKYILYFLFPKITLKFVLKGQIDNKPATLLSEMDWHQRAVVSRLAHYGVMTT